MKKVEHYFYPAVFTYEPFPKIAVDFPDLQCATSGLHDDALLSARELLGCVLYGLEEDVAEIPAPTPLPDVTLPAWLNAAALERNINFSQVLQDALQAQLHIK